jgi:predicted membrane channel-forming protein YqfA (hemolysin III family)
VTAQMGTDAGPAGAGLLYDARRGVYYAKPALRGWLHLLCFWVSLAGGALLAARAHGGAQITAALVYPASLSALFIGLGCAGGLALPWACTRVGTASGVLLLAGGLLYIAGALSYHRRWPDPYPSVFGYHEVFHVCVCAAAACQFAAIARFAG